MYCKLNGLSRHGRRLLRSFTIDQPFLRRRNVRLLADKNKCDFKANFNQGHTSRSSDVSGYIIDFFRKESRILASSLVNSGMEDNENNMIKVFEQRYHSLDPEIRTKIDQIQDVYNKLTLLLTYDPTIIHPDIYMHFFNNLEVSLDPQVRDLLLKRLIFHQHYEECWNILFQSSPTLGDVEELIEIASSILKECDYLELGLIDLVLAFPKNDSTRGIFNSVTEFVSRRVGFDGSIFSSLIEEGGIMGDEHFQMQNVYRTLIHLKYQILESSSVQVIESDLRTQIESIFINPELRQKPGIICFLFNSLVKSFILDPVSYKDDFSGKDKKELGNFLLEEALKNKLVLNQHDFVVIMFSLGTQADEDLIELYLKATRKNCFVSNYLMNRSLECLYHIDVIKRLFMQNFNELNNQTIMKILAHVFKNSRQDFVFFAKKLMSNTSRFSKKSFISLVGNDEFKQLSIHEYFELVKYFNKSDLSSYLIFAIESCIHKNGYTKNELYWYHNQICDNIRLTSYDFVELMRGSILRSNDSDSALLGKLLNKILHRCWSKNTLASAKHIISIDKDEFQKLYEISKSDEKKRLHNRIRSIAQIVSLRSAEECSSILNSFHHHIFGKNFIYQSSHFGKKYIMKNLLNETLRFVERNCDNSERGSIMQMRTLITSLDFDARSAQCYLYKLLVKEDPSRSLVLLNTYKNDKSYLSNDVMCAIMSGILNSNSMSKSDCLKQFREFRNTLNKLGYKNSIRPSTALEVVELVLEVENQKGKSKETLKWILNFSYKKKIPRHIIGSILRKYTQL